MKKILIVDDDEKIGVALSVRLTAAGYEVLVARNGQEGLKLARSNWPDLILLDIGLPIIDIWMPLGVGYSVARRLKSIGRGAIPIIFITASRKDGLREATQKLGPAGFFEKPYDSEELLSAIERILNAQDSIEQSGVSAGAIERQDGIAPSAERLHAGND